ncbi:hypothetical protein [Phytohabitans rumicis]|uniref:Uncharacterized protein n=1 Tax=Phytohabitans rumicis TaxID=1076125 RepID=A0A6V8LPY8_9ACTN|nr:hypothetical protein [Phytohabitans rumicis]GFJ96709.1 hypothetical protein Prum_103510 [Phytohabitans rumicis]
MVGVDGGAGEPSPQSWLTSGSSRVSTGVPAGMVGAVPAPGVFQYCAVNVSLGWSGVVSQLSFAVASTALS